MAPKKVADAAKAKAGKQKKIAIGLGVVLTLAMAYAVHTMMALNGKPSSVPQAAPATLATATTPAPAAGAPPVAPTLGGSVTPTVAAPLSPQLVSAVRPPADSGQLQSFSLFASKDPFNSSGPAAGSASGGTGSGKGSAPKTPPAPPSAPAPPKAPPASAVIAVNGVSESVLSGGAFPAANPVFQVVSLSATTAKLSVVGGSYASGSPTVTLTVNRPVTLQNTADGTRYTLVLMPQGTVATAVPSGSPITSGSTSPGTGTTTTTTTGG